MKRIVISCDGTWSRADARCPTNALKIASAVAPMAADGTVQVVSHVEGVGTGRGTGALARAIDTVLGGALGLGLMRNIIEAYRFLIFNYVPGDQIFLFGFSRGAYTARSLAGLIRNCGILARSSLVFLPRALEIYRSRTPGDHPDGPLAECFRKLHAVEDRTPIAFLGVWDTVGSLGIPEHFWWAARANRELAFHDTALSSSVRSARHAVAIDERRRTYAPGLWSNLERRNAGLPDAPYRQVWFPGDHRGVGGGGDSSFLSNGALAWVADGAERAGLALLDAPRTEWEKGCDCLAPVLAESRLIDRLSAMGYLDREGPDSPEHLAPSARERWRRDVAWRPGALRRIADKL
jgi:uncharacterized protein (DUF2235 family)